VILIIAAILRFWRIESLTTFGGDQGYDFLIVKRMIVDGKLTLLGPKLGPYSNIANVYLGPAYYYLIAPFLLLFRFDPIGPAILMVLLSLATILMIYLIGMNFFSKMIAILASSLYAFNATFIDQSRIALNPLPIPFFSSILIFSVFKVFFSKSSSLLWPILMGLSIGVLFQLHYLAISFIPPLLIILVIFKNLKKLALSLISFLIAVSPQVLFELRHQFFITNQLIKRISQGNDLSSPASFSTQVGRSIQLISKIFLNIEISIPVAVLLLITLILIYVNRQKEKRSILFLLLLVISNVIFASLYSADLQLHYFVSVYASLVLLISIAFFWMFNFFKNFLVKTLLLILLAQIFASNIANLNLSSPEGYTMPKGWNLKGVKKASAIIAADAGPSKFNIAATLDGDTRARPYRYLVEVAGKIPEDVERYPTSDVLYLVARDEDEVIKRYTVWEVASFAPFKIDKKWEIQNGIKLYKLVKTD